MSQERLDSLKKTNKFSLSISVAAWMCALTLVLLAMYLGWRRFYRVTPGTDSNLVIAQAAEVLQVVDQIPYSLPELPRDGNRQSVYREVLVHTTKPDRPSQEVQNYVVAQGDSVFEIASKFNIKPETLLWANYDLLNDNPDTISIGMELKVPPVDGVYYQTKDGDTIQGVAARFEAKLEDILNWSANQLDLTEPILQPETWLMLPGGHREFRQWIIPVIPRGQAGVSKSVYGGGACEGGYDGAFGTGGFIWPAGNHYLSGNDYWAGHLGIDIAAGEGAGVYAADSGVVVFAGWATGGYGYTVIVDHGNGYQTLYAHMSQVSVSCGRSVGQGGNLGSSGSTGNSTGAHLHFEVRFNGGFVNPWYILPAP